MVLRIRVSACFSRILLVFSLSTATHAMDELPILDLDTPLRMNFSGDWEKDFQRSDNWETELERTVNDIRRSIERQQNAGASLSRSGSLSGLPSLRSNRGVSIVDLARLAEYISRQSTMHISQSREEVRVSRRGEPDLVCPIVDGPSETFNSEYGNEICGWDRQQLVFFIQLPDQLLITHRFTVAADSTSLQMVTSISSAGGTPFNLRQTFNRYEAPPESFNCEQTVTRGNVCSQAGTLSRD